MGSIYDQIGRTSVAYAKELRRLTEPLNTFFGVNRFWRNCHRNDGFYSLLGNHIPTAEQFFGLGLYQGHPYFRHPRFFKSGFALPELLHSREYEETQGKLKDGEGCFHVMVAIRKHQWGFVEYGFASSVYRPGFEMTYLNNLGKFSAFIDAFESSAAHLTRKAEEIGMPIVNLVGGCYEQKPQLTENILQPDADLSFFAAIQPDPLLGKALLTLTAGERRVLSAYYSGLSAPEVGKKLYRSPRTVERHIENAKLKLGVRTRAELFELMGALQLREGL